MRAQKTCDPALAVQLFGRIADKDCELRGARDLKGGLRADKVRKRRGIRFSRANVYQRDGYRCQYCRQKFSARELSYDHVVPRAAGGRTCWENIVTACRPCNTRKGSRGCDESGMWRHDSRHGDLQGLGVDVRLMWLA